MGNLPKDNHSGVIVLGAKLSWGIFWEVIVRGEVVQEEFIQGLLSREKKSGG